MVPTLESLKTSYISSASSHKIEVSNKYFEGSYISSILYLAQSKLSGFNLCPWSTPSCEEICLGSHSGRAQMIKKGETSNSVTEARLKKSLLFKHYPEQFFALLNKELKALSVKASKKGVKACFRFNGTSDLMVEHFHVIENHPDIQFYDYTKSFTRMTNFLSGKLPSNYHLTFSYTPENEDKAQAILNLGGNVAVVFNEKLSRKHAPSYVGKSFLGFPIINGDLHDLRFADPKGGYVVGLARKGTGHGIKKAFFIDLDKVS